MHVYTVDDAGACLLHSIPLLTTSRQLFQGHERLLLQHIQDIVLGTGGIWTWQGLINNMEIFRMSMTQGCSKGAAWAAAANEFLAPARQGSRFNTFSLTVNYTHTHIHTYLLTTLYRPMHQRSKRIWPEKPFTKANHICKAGKTKMYIRTNSAQMLKLLSDSVKKNLTHNCIVHLCESNQAYWQTSNDMTYRV